MCIYCVHIFHDINNIWFRSAKKQWLNPQLSFIFAPISVLITIIIPLPARLGSLNIPNI